MAALPGLKRLRYVTPHPKDMGPEDVAAFANIPQLCPRLHLPLQAGSDVVLKRMGRKYDSARYLELVPACVTPARTSPCPRTSSWASPARPRKISPPRWS